MLRQYIYLIAPVMGWIAAQSLKYFFTFRKRRSHDGPELGDLIRSGGMPSSHTAFMSALTAVIGLSSGFDSPLFGLAVALTGIVAYDATGVRRTTGEQTRAIHELEQATKMKLSLIIHDARGHILPEIIAGAFTGGAVGAVLHILL